MPNETLFGESGNHWAIFFLICTISFMQTRRNAKDEKNDKMGITIKPTNDGGRFKWSS